MGIASHKDSRKKDREKSIKLINNVMPDTSTPASSARNVSTLPPIRSAEDVKSTSEGRSYKGHYSPIQNPASKTSLFRVEAGNHEERPRTTSSITLEESDPSKRIESAKCGRSKDQRTNLEVVQEIGEDDTARDDGMCKTNVLKIDHRSTAIADKPFQKSRESTKHDRHNHQGTTGDQSELLSKQEMNDGFNLSARRDNLSSQMTEAPRNAWPDDSSGPENRPSVEQTNGDQIKKSKKEKKKKRNRVEIGEATDINAAERNENQDASSSYNVNKFHEYERNISRLETLVGQLREEKDALLNRLSEIGAIHLTENNPNITDLGDADRYEKVLEQLSELYDNEWTDAYEYLTKIQNKSKERSAKQLLQVLQKTFTICMSSTEKKKKALRKAITDYVGLQKQDQSEIDLKDVEKRIREYRMRKLQNNIKRTKQEVGDELKRILTTEVFEHLSEYIDSCVSICWKICTKEPPMYLDFGDYKEPAQSESKKPTKERFDKAKFVSYTTSGNYLDYVVWPAVYLFKCGPLIKKGVAQGTNDDKEDEYKSDMPT
ncbi:hypothetical protein CHS0354_024444 [Potamilus streckersoni]|uniref:Mitochondria-eating protein C-terminal domain-containing protein n=1 Tax=Potamilus streckersoni TaxID=2493646 RepID=A0AAE0RY05_9BIVA|nr:hypothetical protein CHS0354_024444 [Potamilus streckersoni]